MHICADVSVLNALSVWPQETVEADAEAKRDQHYCRLRVKLNQDKHKQIHQESTMPQNQRIVSLQ